MVREPKETVKESPRWLLQVAIGSLIWAGFGVLVASPSLSEPWLVLDFLPRLGHLGESIRQFDFPSWWGGVALGAPFAPVPTNGVFYPPAWVSAVLPPLYAYKILLVFHLWVAAVGVSYLAKRLGASPVGAVLAAGLFVVSGPGLCFATVGFLGWATAWIPSIAVAFLRVLESSSRKSTFRRSIPVAALVAMPLLLGGIASVGVALFILAAVASAIALKPTRHGGLGAFLILPAAGLLSAVAWVPSIASSIRAGFPILDEASLWGLLLPFSVVGKSGKNPWLLSDVGALPTSLFLGALTLICVLIWGARIQRAGRIVVLTASLVGLFVWQRDSALGFPLLVGGAVLLSSAAGTAAESLLWRPLGKLEQLFVGAFSLSLAGLAIGVWQSLSVGERRVLHGIPELMAFAGTLVVGAAALVLLKEKRKWLLFVWAAAAIGFQLFHARVCLSPLSGETDFSRPVFAVKNKTGNIPERVYRSSSLPMRPASPASAHQTLMANIGTRFGLSYLRGIDQTAGGEFARLLRAASGATERLLDLFSVRYAVVPASVAIPSGMPILKKAKGLALVENEVRRPRAFVTSRYKFFRNEEALITDLFPADRRDRLGVNLATVRFVGTGSDSPSDHQVGNPVPCEIVEYRDSAVTMICEAVQAGFVVLTDRWAEGWNSFVEGYERPVEKADLLVRAVPISEGRHKIQMRYRAPGLAVAAIISCLAWLLWLGAWPLARVTERSRQ